MKTVHMILTEKKLGIILLLQYYIEIVLKSLMCLSYFRAYLKVKSIILVSSFYYLPIVLHFVYASSSFLLAASSSQPTSLPQAYYHDVESY